jgi:hypothetical protein
MADARLALLALLGLFGGFALIVAAAAQDGAARGVLGGAGVLAMLAGIIVSAGLTAVAPGQARVVQLLGRLDEHSVVDLDEERKAAMVSNLLVVLCGDRDAQPVVNTGSLYQ